MNPILMAALAAALAGGPVPEAERPLPVQEKTKHDLERIRKAQEKRERKMRK